MIRLIFRCGHRQDWQDGEEPVCRTCGERQIARSVAPPPRIRGAASGPHVQG